VSLYAATKASNELMAFSYSHLFNIPLTGVRLFTVYGPWGRPDMAVFSFVKKILSRDKLKLFNNGDMKRDFTYIDDVVEGIVRLLCSLPTSPTISLKDYSSGNAASRIVNIGNSNPVSLMDFVSNLENILGIKADIEFSAFQAGDVKSTFADMRKFKSLTGFEFQTPLLEGLKEFVDWYKDYYKKND
jgi:UDP-glucuronate 4-epimerase